MVHRPGSIPGRDAKGAHIPVCALFLWKGTVMASHSDITDRWVQRQVMGSDRNTYERYGWWQSSRVMYWGDRIYSYGEHFVMGEVFRNKDGSPRFVLMDGERYSVSTMQHQSHLRSSLHRHAPDVPVLTVPGPAMREAGIIRESIVPLVGR